MQTSAPLRSGHLDIRDAQYAETKDVLKRSYHIISRFQDRGVQKRRYGRRKMKFSSKVAKFSEKIRTDLITNFNINSFFCVTLSFWDIVNFSNYCVQIFQVFFLSVLGHFFFSKRMSITKDALCYDRNYFIPEFFLCDS